MKFALATLATIVLASGVDAKGGKGKKSAFEGSAFSCSIPKDEADETAAKGGACFAESTTEGKEYEKFGTHWGNLDTTVDYTVALGASCDDVAGTALGDLAAKSKTKKDGTQTATHWGLGVKFDETNAAPAFAAD